MVYSHTKVLDKNVFLKELLSRLDDQSIIKLQMPLKRIANMFNQEIESIAIYIRRILNKMHQLSYKNLCSSVRFCFYLNESKSPPSGFIIEKVVFRIN